MRTTGQSSGFKTWWVKSTNTSDSIWSQVLTRHLSGTWLSRRAAPAWERRVGFSGGLRRAGCPGDKGIPDLTLTIPTIRANIYWVLTLSMLRVKWSLLICVENYEVGSVLSPTSLLGKLKLCYIKNPAHHHRPGVWIEAADVRGQSLWRRECALWEFCRHGRRLTSVDGLLHLRPVICISNHLGSFVNIIDAPPNNYIRISRDGAQASCILKAPRWLYEYQLGLLDNDPQPICKWRNWGSQSLEFKQSLWLTRLTSQCWWLTSPSVLIHVDPFPLIPGPPLFWKCVNFLNINLFCNLHSFLVQVQVLLTQVPESSGAVYSHWVGWAGPGVTETMALASSRLCYSQRTRSSKVMPSTCPLTLPGRMLSIHYSPQPLRGHPLGSEGPALGKSLVSISCSISDFPRSDTGKVMAPLFLCELSSL